MSRRDLVEAPGNFDVAVDRQGSNVTVAPKGEVDLATVRVVRDAVEQSDNGFESLVLDLREVSFMDTSGLRYVLELNERAEQEGFRLALVRGPAAVQRVFEISGLDARLPFVDEPGAGPHTGD